jgi:N6-adenosine-specific RNA methylase IME4
MNRRQWAALIQKNWRRSVEAVLACGRALVEAKAQLPHGEFVAMIGADLPFRERTAQQLMAVVRDPRLVNTNHGSLLPPSWRTLYELTKLDDENFARLLSAGAIRPDMQRRDVSAFNKREKRKGREQALGSKILALPNKRYGVILADPEWRFEVWSRETGLDNASADNHYQTSPLEDIKRRDVASIAADDCALFLWSTVPFEAHAHDVIKAWGFAYKSQLVWIKDKLATGYWFRNRHEILLLATRGDPPVPAPGTQWESVLEAPVGRHSEKPTAVYDLIEAYFPSLPKIELNAREARSGWDAWGFEAPREAAA